MKTSNLFLTFCLLSGVASAQAVPAKRTADIQMQGTSNDVEVTRKIRDRLTSDDSLSTNAQNVTIVTLGNTVTLKGDVKKKDEIQKISSVARELAAGKTIKNELRVIR